MAEAPNRQLVAQGKSTLAPSSVADAKAAIRETRARITMELTSTADRVNTLFTRPAAAEEEPRQDGLAGVAARSIAAAGQAKRVWGDARSTGLVRRSIVGTLVAGIALAIAARATRRAVRRR